MDGMSKPDPTRYRTTNWSDYKAALRKRRSVLIWLDKDMTWLAPHDGSPDRPAVFSDAAIQFCLKIKGLFKLPLRQTTGMVASVLKMADLDWAFPDYTTLCRRQKTLAVQIPYRRAEGPLNLSLTAPGSSFSVMANGRRASMAFRADASGARCPRPPNCRNPDPHRTGKLLQRSRHRRDRSCGLTSAGKGEVIPQPRVTQQCLSLAV